MRKEFSESLKTVAKPALERYGYVFDGKRRFIKKNTQGAEFIIEYQVGVRAAAGTFTVNLIIGDKVERLSCIKPTKFSGIINSIFGKHDPWWKGILLPKDKWWAISPSQKEMDSIVNKTIRELEKYGISWLEKTDISA